METYALIKIMWFIGFHCLLYFDDFIWSFMPSDVECARAFSDVRWVAGLLRLYEIRPLQLLTVMHQKIIIK